jgi:hypothetical protein
VNVEDIKCAMFRARKELLAVDKHVQRSHKESSDNTNSIESELFFYDNSQLICTESIRHPTFILIVLFICSLPGVFVFYCLLAWTFWDRPLPEIIAGRLGRTISGICMVPTALFLLAILNAAFPRRLILNEGGISYQALGNRKAISWDKVSELSTKKIQIRSSEGIKRFHIKTIVRSDTGEKIGWMPIADVPPEEIIALIETHFSRHHQGKVLPIISYDAINCND